MGKGSGEGRVVVMGWSRQGVVMGWGMGRRVVMGWGMGRGVVMGMGRGVVIEMGIGVVQMVFLTEILLKN